MYKRPYIYSQIFKQNLIEGFFSYVLRHQSHLSLNVTGPNKFSSLDYFKPEKLVPVIAEKNSLKQCK